MIEKEAQIFFWLDVINWAMHLMNRSSTNAVKDVTLKEAQSNLKSSVNNFKVFGCVGYVQNPY